MLSQLGPMCHGTVAHRPVRACSLIIISSNRNVLKSLKGFRIGHLNITSLVKHVDELRIYMEDKPFDILSINESHLDDTVNLNTVDIQGYEILI